MLNRLAVLSITLLLASLAIAQIPTTQPTEGSPGARFGRGMMRGGGGDGAGPSTQPAEDKLVVTDHEITINGQPLRYKATAGTIAMKDEFGKPKANFYFTAYELKHNAATTQEIAAHAAKRPITFVFNGGPGAASVWLHLGVVGPRRIEFPDDGIPGPPPSRLVDNQDTWLPFTDIVLLDPVGTGYSRPAQGEDGRQFWGLEQDAASVGDFIRLYLTRYERWTSPKFLAGESYGTTRAARLSDYLADRYGINVNGIVLISTVLSFQTISPGDGNDLPFVLYLPTYTNVAAYHKKLANELTTDLPRTLREVEKFAIDEYQPALARGAGLTADARKQLVDKLSRYTGLSSDLIEKANLRISPYLFEKYILADQRKVIGRFDGRITGFDPNPLSPSPGFDPSYSCYQGPYSSCFHDYVRRELQFQSDLPYEVLTGRVRPWDFGPGGGGYVNVADELRNAMIQHPQMRVMVAEGMYDFATPYFASDYVLNQLDLSPELRNNITRTYYPGGHMMYHVGEGRVQLSKDVRDFFGK